MINKKALATFFAKSVTLGISFLLVILTSRLWGAEGRGLIALIVADIAIISIISNIATGSSISYYTPKIGFNSLFPSSILFGFILVIISALGFSFFHGFHYFQFLFIVSILIAYLTMIMSFSVARENIKLYNLVTFLMPGLTIIFVLFLYYIVGYKNVENYFYAQYLAFGLILIYLFIMFTRKYKLKEIKLSLEATPKLLKYGVQNELSTFLQFLNNRLSYYFIAEYIGMAMLGVFSVAMSVSEAILILSRSLAIVQYSKVLNQSDQNKNIILTKQNVILCLIATSLLMLFLVFLPASIYNYIFGKGFINVKHYTILLFPGILILSVSNLWGNYFSAIGNLKVLKRKSALGLVVTLIFAILLVPKYNLTGACITMNLSYFTSSLYLFIHFLKDVKKYNR